MLLGETLITEELGVHTAEGGITMALGLLDPVSVILLVLIMVSMVL